MINIGVDQFTLILKPNFKYDYSNWLDKSVQESVIMQFISLSKMQSVFGKLSKADVTLPSGYTNGYNFNNKLYYFCIAYHEYYYKMNIIVKISGYAWHMYCKLYKEIYKVDMNIREFFKIIDSKIYSSRLSRCDLYVDFIDEGIDVNKITKSIGAGRTEIRYGKK
ncbi:hypothetical protein [Anaerococcus sp.]|uniref:hypothetical protein n=1 Tax=Anaerococcus sp. TaxID=1872515 RepID=UPI0028FDCF61|nr:hypothetical protein [Anaerococcus sp.]MDU3212355.1 hypothetical protein [Anaerococcus sp.]